MNETTSDNRWIDGLTDEDRVFIKRFVLASGSLKEIARIYGVTYPTVRLRLDRLIQKIELLDTQHPLSDFERRLRALYADGRIDLATMKELLAGHQQEMEKQHVRHDHPDQRP
jgi:hypothetical protein